MKEVTFTGKTDKELLAVVAQWLAAELAKNKNEPEVEPQGGDGGGPG
jgi:hypothetical protein